MLMAVRIASFGWIALFSISAEARLVSENAGPVLISIGISRINALIRFNTPAPSRLNRLMSAMVAMNDPNVI